MNLPTVGDVVRPAYGGAYRGVVTYVSRDEDVVRHRCLTTGMVFQKSVFDFVCSYCTLAEYDAIERETQRRIMAADKAARMISEWRTTP